MTETVNHPDHYGGDTEYEAIKLIKDWGLGFDGGNALKYVVRTDKKDDPIENLEKAVWYLNDAIKTGETLDEYLGWGWMLLPLVAVELLKAFGVRPARRTTLDPVKAARFHGLNIRLTQALEYIHVGGFQMALTFVEDELRLRQNQLLREVAHAGR